MLSNSEIKRRKKLKKPEFDTSNFSEFKLAEKKYKYYENESTDYSELLSENSPECK